MCKAFGYRMPFFPWVLLAKRIIDVSLYISYVAIHGYFGGKLWKYIANENGDDGCICTYRESTCPDGASVFKGDGNTYLFMLNGPGADDADSRKNNGGGDNRYIFVVAFAIHQVLCILKDISSFRIAENVETIQEKMEISSRKAKLIHLIMYYCLEFFYWPLTLIVF